MLGSWLFYQHAQHHGLTLNNRFVLSALVLRHSDGAVDWGLIVWAIGAPCPSFLSADAQMATSGKSGPKRILDFFASWRTSRWWPRKATTVMKACESRRSAFNKNEKQFMLTQIRWSFEQGLIPRQYNAQEMFVLEPR